MGSIDFSGFRWSILPRMCPDFAAGIESNALRAMVDGRHRNQPEPDIRLLCLESLTPDYFVYDLGGYLEIFIVLAHPSSAQSRNLGAIPWHEPH
jgi:hypothetical protein